MLKNILSMSALSVYRSAIQFAFNIALARFVQPAEYGLVVFTLPFVVFIAMMTDMGLSSAIVRSEKISSQQAGAAFTLVSLVGIAAALLFSLCSIPIARWTHMQGLSGVMSGMSISLILTICGSVPRAILERELQYKYIASTEAGAVIIAVSCGLLSAWQGAGVWSLVIFNILSNGIRLILFYRRVEKRMVLNFLWKELLPLVSFGAWVLATNILNFFARNSDNLLIGVFLGSASVGLYGLSYQFMIIPLMAITWPASGVLLATLSRTGIDTQRGAELISGIIGLTSLLTFPAMIYLMIGFDYPASVLLSAKWQGITQIIFWLAPVGALQSVAAYNGSVLLVAGRAQAQFWYSILNTLAIVGTFIVSLPFGLNALVTSYAVVATLLSVGFLILIISLTAITLPGLLLTLAPATVATVSAVAAVLALRASHLTGALGWSVKTALYGFTVLSIYAIFRSRIKKTAISVLHR